LIETAESESQNVSAEKRPFNGKFQNLPTKKINAPVIRIFLPSFVEIGEAEVTKPMRGNLTKMSVFGLFLRGPENDLAEIFTESLFSDPS